MSLAWSNAKSADEREKRLKTARLRRPAGDMRPPVVYHTLGGGHHDEVPDANWDWVDEAQTAAAFVVLMMLLGWGM